MKKLNVLMQAAVAAGVLGVSSQAMATITLGDSTADAVKYASELATNGMSITDPNIAVVTPLGFGTSSGATRYVRFDLTNAKFTNAVVAANGTIANTGGSAAVVTVAAGGTTADSYVIFQLTSPSGTGLAVSDNFNLALQTAGVKVTTAGTNVDVSYSLYDVAGDAVNGTATGRLSNKSETVAKFGTALSLTVTPATSQAKVADEFKKFASSAVTTALGNVTLGVNTTYRSVGTAVVIGDLTATGTKLVVAGDFGAVDTAVGGGIYTGTAVGCTTPTTAGTMNTAKTSADITINALAVAGLNVCYTVTGTTVVPVQTPTVALTVVAAGTSTTASVAAQTLGSITHDGTTMVAPLAQVPAGWLSRLVLNNTGAASRAYTVTAIGETGNTITLTGAAASGTLAAGTTTVVDLAGLLTATGTPRSGLKVVVAGPPTEIDGLYQIVNGTTGSVSNHVLAYK